MGKTAQQLRLERAQAYFNAVFSRALNDAADEQARALGVKPDPRTDACRPWCRQASNNYGACVACRP